MYHYYTYDGRTLCSAGALPYPEISALPETGEVLWVFHRPPLSGRDTFPVTDPAQLTEREGVASLCAAPGPEGLPRELTNAIRAGRVRAVNLAHPRFEELMAPLPRPEKVRVNLLALGDVGSTLLMGLRLMGGDVISSIGICDLREGVAQRWEFELNQIQLPGPYDALPPVEIVSPEQLFDGDVFLFCASRFVPDTAVKTGDVRMAQYRLNRELAALYAQKARQARYRGLFCVVSDPVDPLCRAVLTESNRAPSGEMDYQGLFSHQVRGFGLGVMNARAAYYARKDPRFASFLTEGRSFGPHGDRPRHPPDAGDGLQALCGPGPVLRGPESAAVSAGPVALLLHLSGRGVHGSPEPGAPHRHGAGASASAPAAARPPANHYGPPAGH